MSVEAVTEKLAEVSVSSYLLSPGSSTSELAEEDSKVSQLLELLDEYEQLANDSMRLNYVKGFQDLSRANYNGTKRHGVDSFDLRPYRACTIVANDGELVVIDRLEAQNEREKQRKVSEKKDRDKRANEDEMKEDQNEIVKGEQITSGGKEHKQVDDGIVESTSVSTSTGELRNRKSKVKDTQSKETVDFESKESSKDPTRKTQTYKNPINQFGGLVPYQLRTAQDHFKRALADSVKVINLQQRILALIEEIET